jgi:hypothetical protein
VHRHERIDTGGPLTTSHARRSHSAPGFKGKDARRLWINLSISLSRLREQAVHNRQASPAGRQRTKSAHPDFRMHGAAAIYLARFRGPGYFRRANLRVRSGKPSSYAFLLLQQAFLLRTTAKNGVSSNICVVFRALLKRPSTAGNV